MLWLSILIDYAIPKRMRSCKYVQTFLDEAVNHSIGWYAIIQKHYCELGAYVYVWNMPFQISETTQQNQHHQFKEVKPLI